MKRLVISVFFICLLLPEGFGVISRNAYPEVGKPCPEILLKNIQFYDRPIENIQNLKGKWIILDFWSKYCVSCIRSFPKTNAMQVRYKGIIQFFLIGRRDKENEIETVYERFRKKLNLNLSVCYDSVLFERYDISACPYILVIDDKGIVRAITLSINEKDIDDFLNGGKPELEKAYRSHERPDYSYDPNKPLLIAGNGGSDSEFLYRSVITSWKSTDPEYRIESINDFFNHSSLSGFEALGASVADLYKYAYFGFFTWTISDWQYGKYTFEPLFEIKDSSIFKDDRAKGKNIFSYSLIIPKENKQPEMIQELMKKDLEAYFGFTGEIQRRNMACWKLVVIDTLKAGELTSKIASLPSFIPHAMIYVKNKPISYLLGQIWANFQIEPLIDETHIESPISLAEDANMTDFSDIRRALQKHGLDLVKSQKEMITLVIRESRLKKIKN